MLSLPSNSEVIEFLSSIKDSIDFITWFALSFQNLHLIEFSLIRSSISRTRSLLWVSSSKTQLLLLAILFSSFAEALEPER